MIDSNLVDGGIDEEGKVELIGDLFKTGPNLSPRRAKRDTKDDKIKLLEDEVVFLRNHSKTLQSELGEASSSLAIS